MHIRAFTFTLALSVGAAMAAGAGAGDAATLFTTSAHTTPVSVGSAISASATSPFNITSATSLFTSCASSSLSGTVTQNSGGTVVGSITSGSLSSCTPFTWVATFPTAWALTISGSSTTVGGTTVWSSVALHNLRFDLNNGPYSGSLAGGISARQAHASGPICLQFADVGTITGPLTGNGRIDTNYCFRGPSANYSLG